ncbi:MAG: FAD-dependent oxidoreductase [Fimbriimonadaceae bacterium]|nr:FAD-dependent oxidoreductase [Fimbriimonadaceae bacterium]
MAGMRCDVLIVGGGVGGCAAAQALAVSGLTVVMTEPTAWIGGQLTNQMVPPDEHPWIETHGSSLRYRTFRESIRDYYRAHEALTLEARRNRILNPGGGWVSRLCFAPEIGVKVLEESFRATLVTGRLKILKQHVPLAADVAGDEVKAVTFRNESDGSESTIEPRIILEASEVGDLLPLAGIEYRIGSEARAETGEPQAGEFADSTNVQSFTWVIAVASEPGHTQDPSEPENYRKWKEFAPVEWPFPQLDWRYYDRRERTERPFDLYGGPGLGLFSYRQVVWPEHFTDNRPPASLVNWPQNDFQGGGIVDVPDEEKVASLNGARELSLSLLYWLQTDAPRPDGGVGFPELRAAPEFSGTPDGLAMAPYIREGRRIRARHTIREQDVSADANPGLVSAPPMPRAVGIGAYRIDLHPGAQGQPGLDASCLPFQIPLGALLPERVTNVIAAGKCLGTTHITNGCYRLHPVEWVIGEVAGLLAAQCLKGNLTPGQVYEDDILFGEFEDRLRREGVEFAWPTLRAL